MASIITATTTSGLTQSADNSGVLQLASGTGNLVTVPSATGTMALTTSGTPVADYWILNTGFSNTADSTNTITVNLNRLNSTGTGTTANMSQSSGVFTFPQTGLYRVVFTAQFYSNSNTCRLASNRINISIDGGSTFTQVARASGAINAIVSASNTFITSTAETQVNVTNTSTVKVNFDVTTTATINLNGDGTYPVTYMIFQRLGNSV